MPEPEKEIEGAIEKSPDSNTEVRPSSLTNLSQTDREDTLRRILEQTRKNNLELSDEEMNLLTDDRSIATPEQKMAAVMEWYLTGSNTKAAVATRNPEVNHRLIYRWRQSKWWNKLIEKCEMIRNEEISQLQSITYFTTLEKVQDAVENGDLKWDSKNACYVRVPIPAKDLAYLANALADQRAHGMSKGAVENKTTEQMLQQLAQSLTKTLADATKAQKGVTIHDNTPEKDIIEVNT